MSMELCGFKVVTLDSGLADEIRFVGAQPDRRKFPDDESFFREWAKRCFLIRAVSTQLPAQEK